MSFYSKQEIIKRLYDEKHITFDEMVTLLEEAIKYVPQPFPAGAPYYPFNPSWPYFY